MNLPVAPSSDALISDMESTQLDTGTSIEPDITIYNCEILQQFAEDNDTKCHRPIKTECTEIEQNNDDLHCEIDIKEEKLGIKLENSDIRSKFLNEDAEYFEDGTNVEPGKLFIYTTHLTT